jgi:hypothetical protein
VGRSRKNEDRIEEAGVIDVGLLEALEGAGATAKVIIAAVKHALMIEQVAVKRADAARRQRTKRSTDQADLFTGTSAAPELPPTVTVHSTQAKPEAAAACAASPLSPQPTAAPASVTERDVSVTERDVAPPPFPPNGSPTPPPITTLSTPAAAADARATVRPLISAEAIAIADEVSELAGIDPRDRLATPPGWCGAAMRVEAWLGAGYPREAILAGVRLAMARERRKRDGPPATPIYFERAIAELHAQQSVPVARGSPGASAGTAGLRGVPRPGSREDRQERYSHAIRKLRAFAGRPDDAGAGSADGRSIPRVLPVRAES